MSISGLIAAPELAKVGSALIGRIVAPEQLAAHFGIQSDQIRFDECWIGLQQGDRVRRHLLQAGEEKILRKIAQRFIHRLREIGRIQNRFERIALRLGAGGDGLSDACTRALMVFSGLRLASSASLVCDSGWGLDDDQESRKTCPR